MNLKTPHSHMFSALFIAPIFLIILSLYGCEDKSFLAWTVINSSKGMKGDAGRSEALEYLNERGASLRGIDLSNAWLNDIDLSGAKMEGVCLRNAYIMDVDLSEAALPEAKLEYTWLWRVRLRETDMRFSYLRGTKVLLVDLREADLRMADMERAIVSLADFGGADLRKASLRRVNFCDCLADSSALCMTSFRGADLRETDLFDIREWRRITDLTGANLAGVRNSPPDFLEWAIDTMQAVQEPSDSLWHAIRDSVLCEECPDYFDEWTDRDWDAEFEEILWGEREEIRSSGDRQVPVTKIQ